MRAPHQTATGRRARWKSQLEKIKSEFSISMTHLARFLNVERPTVYQWFGAAEPRRANLQRINTLAELADAWSDFQSGSIRPYLDRPVTGNGPSLDDLLSAPQLDSDLLISSFASATASGRAVRDRDQFSLADRLAARGFSPYGEETRKRSRAGKISSTSPGEDPHEGTKCRSITSGFAAMDGARAASSAKLTATQLQEKYRTTPDWFWSVMTVISCMRGTMSLTWNSV